MQSAAATFWRFLFQYCILFVFVYLFVKKTPVKTKGPWIILSAVFLCKALLRWSYLFTFDHSFPDLSSSPPGPYLQDAYVTKPDDKLKHPPFLPPHLLQVLLNKDTGISVSPGLTLLYLIIYMHMFNSSCCEFSTVWPDTASRA